jgi:hypothetical protein
VLFQCIFSFQQVRAALLTHQAVARGLTITYEVQNYTHEIISVQVLRCGSLPLQGFVGQCARRGGRAFWTDIASATGVDTAYAMNYKRNDTRRCLESNAGKSAESARALVLRT